MTPLVKAGANLTHGKLIIRNISLHLVTLILVLRYGCNNIVIILPL